MGNSQIKYVVSSFSWTSIAKILDACIKFLTIPLLIHYFGKDNYGLLTLAFATNAYMQLLDMGMNTGAVKFFSQWIADKKFELIDKVSRTNLSFYLLIGTINALVLVFLAFWGESVFKVTPVQFIVFRKLLLTLALFTIIDWCTFVFNQLLIADERIGFTQRIFSIKSLIGFLLVILTTTFKWSLTQYFWLNLILNVSVILPYYFVCKKRKLIRSIIPAFYWSDFFVIFKYGLAILAMGLFQFTATQSRPLVLGMFSKVGVSLLTEYRVVEVFPIFIISIGGMLITILLPKTSKAILNNDRALIEIMAYKGTSYASILISILCFPIILSSKELLTLFVGADYSHLYIWLSLWVLSITLFLHNSPVASLVLATGKTKMLVYSSAIASTVSIIINAILCGYYGVGSAVIGYLIYIIIQMSFYYFYFNNKVLGLKSMNVFKAFIVPTLIGFALMVGIYFLKIHLNSLIIEIILKSVIWGFGYVLCLVIFKVVDISNLISEFKHK